MPCLNVVTRDVYIICSFDETLWRRLDLANKVIKSGVLGRILSRGVAVMRLTKAEVSSPSYHEVSQPSYHAVGLPSYHVVSLPSGKSTILPCGKSHFTMI